MSKSAAKSKSRGSPNDNAYVSTRDSDSENPTFYRRKNQLEHPKLLRYILTCAYSPETASAISDSIVRKLRNVELELLLESGLKSILTVARKHYVDLDL